MRSEARKNSPRLMAAWAVCGLTMMAASSFAAAITISSPDGQLPDYRREFKFSYPDTPINNAVIFGVSVAISGDTALVGAMRDQGPNGEQGAAYVLVRSGNTWVQQAKLVASDAPAGSNYGHTVALSGDTALIGAPSHGSGKAYVYVRSAGVWTQQAQLVAANVGSSIGQFGYSVALSGDTALIGVPSDDLGDSYAHGSAFVFTRSGNDWSEQHKLLPSDIEPVKYFGNSVALDGDTAVIGAHYDTIGSNAQQGSAYVFARSDGVWNEQGKLVAPDGAAQDLFGTSLAVSGDTAVVGAFLDDHGTGSNQGSAYVFVRNGGVWSLQTKLLMANAQSHTQFGMDLAIDGDKLLIGARHDSVATSRQGSVNVFTRYGSTWTQGQKIIASDGRSYDYFGNSFAISGDDLIVAADSDEPPQAPDDTDSGSVYFFDAVPPQADLQVTLSNNETQLIPGQSTTYEVVVANAGPENVPEATLSYAVPAVLINVQWTCSTVAGAAICPHAQGSGNDIAESLQLPVNSALRYRVTATVNADPGAFIGNTATVTAAAPVVDGDQGNNSATDQDPVLSIGLFADGFETILRSITVVPN